MEHKRRARITRGLCKWFSLPATSGDDPFPLRRTCVRYRPSVVRCLNFLSSPTGFLCLVGIEVLGSKRVWEYAFRLSELVLAVVAYRFVSGPARGAERWNEMSRRGTIGSRDSILMV